VGLTAIEDLVDLVEDGREGIRLLLIHFCLGHKIYSLLWRRVTLSQIVRLTSSKPWAGQTIARPFRECFEARLFALRRLLIRITKGEIEFIPSRLSQL
jgi:hypothetical protein